eukprot:747147-Hanusia_phi.AAC.2
MIIHAHVSIKKILRAQSTNIHQLPDTPNSLHGFTKNGGGGVSEREPSGLREEQLGYSDV